MEDLTKTQTILLCLLVSFVTSISTGIITYSLLDKAPQAITQTINRVVERTIEKVVPSAVGENTVTKEVTTVVVKEDDLIVSAISKNEKSLVRIFTEKEKTPYGIGLIVSKDGLVVADASNFKEDTVYVAKLSDEKEHTLSFVSEKASVGIVLFNLKSGEGDTITYVPATLGNSDKLALGQTVIGTSGFNDFGVGVGRVLFLKKTSTVESTPSFLSEIKTDINFGDANTGGPLLDLSGQVMGLNIGTNTSLQNISFIPINLIKSAIEKESTQN